MTILIPSKKLNFSLHEGTLHIVAYIAVEDTYEEGKVNWDEGLLINIEEEVDVGGSWKYSWVLTTRRYIIKL